MNINHSNLKCLFDQVLHNLSVNIKDKVKTYESPGLCFELYILSRKQQTKLELMLTKKFFVQVYTHFGPAVKKGKTERVNQIDAQFCARASRSQV